MGLSYPLVMILLYLTMPFFTTPGSFVRHNLHTHAHAHTHSYIDALSNT